jgi:hypothetical protein
MPRVGTKQFPYTEEGIQQARAESRMTGIPISSETSLVAQLLQEEENTRMPTNNTRTKRTPRVNNRMTGRATKRTPTKRMRY